MSSGATYIAVVIVLVILIGFVLTMVNMLAKTAGSKIRTDMQRVISTYDSIIAMKAKEIDEMKNDAKVVNRSYGSRGLNSYSPNLVQNSATPASNNFEYDDSRIPISSFIIPSVSYRSSVLADNYEEIKNSFMFNDRSIKTEVERIEKENKQNKFIDACVRIINGLSFNGVYELATLKSIDQVKLLKENLHSNDVKVLEAYLDLIGNEEKFDGIRFYDWVKRAIDESSDIIEIRTSSSKDEKQFDPSICDGYRIYVGNKMYDYAISKKDVS